MLFRGAADRYPARMTKMLTTRECATRLGCSTVHVVHLIERGELAAVSIGTVERKAYRVRADSLETFIVARTVQPQMTAA
jgi:excisionase family DNA binding protein